MFIIYCLIVFDEKCANWNVECLNPLTIGSIVSADLNLQRDHASKWNWLGSKWVWFWCRGFQDRCAIPSLIIEASEE